MLSASASTNFTRSTLERRQYLRNGSVILDASTVPLMARDSMGVKVK